MAVGASSINGSDLGLVGGGLISLAFGHGVLGFDLCGEVVACGPAVTAFDVGDRVVALLDHQGGGAAEQVLVPQDRVALAPSTVVDDAAAALPLSGLTALQMLRGRAGVHVRTAPRVLVIGAAGGIGSFAVLLAALHGARTTAVASHDRQDHLTGLGADEVVTGRAQDLLGGGERWDVVLDCPAALSSEEARPLLTEDGVMVSTQAISTDVVRGALRQRLGGGGPTFRSVRTKVGHDLAHLVRLVDDGRLRIPLDRPFPLAEVQAAHAYAGGHDVRGKVVLSV